MAYKAEIRTCPDHIRVDVSGHRKPGKAVRNAYEIGKQIIAESRKTDIDKVLLVSRLTGRLPALDAYKMVAGLEDVGWSRSTRLAFVDLNAESRADSLFTETVAVNRAYLMKVFDNENDARRWLLEP
ncbi:MAG: hypothetical protein OEM60_08185 [Gammaproteobacteria bacterium]|nr:hypothetical protein [Gammaproteobacteria bacterium]MDH3430530.1 hypothetical protein [Gammaproteobacteria bacterium]MDH3433821.1 hypothetical protein [Gammaproteobacteria bacterium]